MAELGTVSRVRPARNSDGNPNVGMVAEDRQRLAQIRLRFRLLDRLLPSDVFRVSL
jgi:hypothetical protein